MAINAEALICSRLMIRALALILGEELSFSDWQPELFITQPESQSSALQVTNQSQALSVGKEWKQVWNGQQQFAKMKPNFCLSPPASCPPWSSSTRISSQSWRQFSRGMKITAIPGIARILQGHKAFSQQQETQKSREIQVKPQQCCQKDNRKTREFNSKLLLVFLLLIWENPEDNEHPLPVPQHPPELAGTHQHGYDCLSHFLAWNFVSEH